MEIKKIYFAAPLFDDMELERNLKECAKLEAAGFEVYLPQRDAGEAAEGASRVMLFQVDTKAVTECDAVIAYIDGRVPDEGTVFEMGMAYALDKTLCAIRTDRRAFMNSHLNVMLEESSYIFGSTEEAITWLK